MSSLVNKFADSVAKTTSSLVGRDNVTKLTNSLNKTLFSSKYRDLMKAGNTVQIISKTSRMSLHICVSQNDPNRLILLGNGQIGPTAFNSHFLIEKEAKNGHLKFKNGNHYICFDNEVPCILSEPNPNPKNAKDSIRTRNEFRLVELIGSDENFTLESVYYPGRYLAVLPDGSITTTRNRADREAHFCMNLIHLMPVARAPLQQPIVIPVSEGVLPSSSSSIANINNNNNDNNNQNHKEDEAVAYQNNGNSNAIANTSSRADQAVEQLPPSYSNLYPSLPR